MTAGRSSTSASVVRRLSPAAFFPQPVAGPIERSHRLLPQIINPRKRREDDFANGLYLVVTGLFAKIVIADNMAFICNGIFAAPTSEVGGIDRVVGIYAFAFQIYGDFYGYSAIARGISLWMGIDLMRLLNHVIIFGVINVAFIFTRAQFN